VYPEVDSHKARLRAGCHGQGAPQVVTSPLGQMTGVPAAQSTMSQPSVPASAAGQWTTQAAPAAQLV
jgi:hypothetical protein